MMRVDIIGPPGSGKTTILNSVMRSEIRAENWYTDKEFFLLANMLLFKKKNPDLLDIIKQAAFRVFKKKLLLPVCRVQREHFFSESLKQYHKLLEFVNDAFSLDTHTHPDINAYRNMLFKNEMEKVVLLQYINKYGVVFFEESLAYKYFETVGDNYSVCKHIEKIKENCFPLPDSCIFISEPVHTLLQRLAKRNKVTRAHSQMTKHDIEFHVKKSIRSTKVAVKVLAEMNVPVLKIGEGDSVRQSARKIHQFITQFEEK